MGAIGGVIRATGPSSVKVATQVKNPAIDKAIQGALSNYSSYTSGEQSALSDYINKYLGQQKQFETQVGQESGAIGQFYTGEMAQKLAALRGQREAAINAAADVGVKQALAGVDRSRLGEEGGTSSYDRRLAIGATTPIRVGAAVDTANQARADLGYLTQNQLGLTGQRENLANALAAYGLVPYQTAGALQKADLANLSGITNLDEANRFYGLQQNRNRWADAADSLDAGILNAASIYSSVAGGMMSRGGPVVGPGDEHSDSIPINVSAGEFVVPASAVRIPGVLPLLQRIRAAGLAKEHSESVARNYDFGGYVSDLWDAVRGKGRRNQPPPDEYEMQLMDNMSFATGGLIKPLIYDAGTGAYRAGGFVVPKGYQGGGMIDFSDVGSEPTYDPYGGGGGGKRGGGGGGGGLAGEAQYLLQRASADLQPAWRGPAFIPGGAGFGGVSPRPVPTPRPVASTPMPRAQDWEQHFMSLYGPKAVPSNFGDLPPEYQQQYTQMYGRARQIEAGFPGGVNPYE